jgi:hypothetical protein
MRKRRASSFAHSARRLACSQQRRGQPRRILRRGLRRRRARQHHHDLAAHHQSAKCCLHLPSVPRTNVSCSFVSSRATATAGPAARGDQVRSSAPAAPATRTAPPCASQPPSSPAAPRRARPERGRKPKNVNGSGSMPDATSAASSADAPGTGTTSCRPSSTARTSRARGPTAAACRHRTRARVSPASSQPTTCARARPHCARARRRAACDAVAAEQDRRAAGVLREDAVHVLQHGDRAERDVLQVPDGCADNIEN